MITAPVIAVVSGQCPATSVCRNSIGSVSGTVSRISEADRLPFMIQSPYHGPTRKSSRIVS